MRGIRGITLVALVITIIVLLILAGVAINLSIGNNGLFTRADNAANTWKRAEEKEQEEIKKFANTYDELVNSLESNGEDEGTITKPIDEIIGDETRDIETTDKQGNRIVIPAGFKVINPTATVEEGIVIEDVSANNSDTVGNQFVWVPCTLDGSSGSLKYDRYAFTRDDWQYRQTKLNEKDADGSYKILRENNTEYYYHEAMSDMERASIEKYGGYYFGRYETGCETQRDENSKGNIEQVAKIHAGLNVYNYITIDESKAIAERMYNGKSKLCSSYAWDTALKFIDGNEGTYTVNSIGDNYTGDVKNTGYYNKKNIYDMGGNVLEWTTEKCINQESPCVYRGGDYGTSASDGPAAIRINYYTKFANINIGMRTTLYL